MAQKRSRIQIKSTRKGMVDHRLNLDDLPLWALRADLDFAKRKLQAGTKRLKQGRPCHGRYANYEQVLKSRIADLLREIRRRQGRVK